MIGGGPRSRSSSASAARRGCACRRRRVRPRAGRSGRRERGRGCPRRPRRAPSAELILRAHSRRSIRSTSRHEYPHSLSYQPITLTMVPCAIVERPSMMQEYGLPTMSDETIGSSVYWRIPAQWSDVGRRAEGLVHLVRGRGPLQDADEVGDAPVRDRHAHRHPVQLPFQLGDDLADRLRRAGRGGDDVDRGARACGAGRACPCASSRPDPGAAARSCTRGSVVMKPCSIPKLSRRIFAIGPTEFVVQDAFEMMWCFSASYASSLTPSTIVRSGSVAGAEMTTLSAPAVRCCAAPSRFGEEAGRLDDDVDLHVLPRQARTGRAPRARGRQLPSTEISPSETSTSSSSRPCVES